MKRSNEPVRKSRVDDSFKMGRRKTRCIELLGLLSLRDALVVILNLSDGSVAAGNNKRLGIDA